jgi:hypothetical protein
MCTGRLVRPGTDWHVAAIDSLLKSVERLAPQQLPSTPGAARRDLGQLVQVQRRVNASNQGSKRLVLADHGLGGIYHN